MEDIPAKEIRCPKSDDHIHKKILLIVGDDFLSIFCNEHGWIKIELKNGKETINFKNVRAKISSYKKNTHFDLSSIPGIAIGKFESKRKRHGSPA